MIAVKTNRHYRWGHYMLVGLVLALCFVSIGDQVHLAAAQTSQQTVVVQPGETLFRIALRYNVTVESIVAANGLIDASHIYAGQTLIIPNVTSVAVPAPAVPVVNQQAPQTYAVNYIVQLGDTVGNIALKYGVSAATIIAANGLIDANHIEVGQAIVIPGVNGAGIGSPNAPQIPSVLVTPSPNGVIQPITPAPTAIPIAAASPATAVPVVAPVTIASTYTVQAGEDLAAIARKFGVSWTAIAAFNNISDPNLIYAGMVLKIPSASATVNTTVNSGSSDAPPGPASADPADSKQIVVVLHEERFYAYENGVLVRDVLVSTGLPLTPTVTGTFHIYAKYTAQLMVGPDYYLPNVPWVSYFYEGYALHGTYWHHNWGHEMSHGCVNMPTDEAKWVFDWAPVGTTVTVMW